MASTIAMLIIFSHNILDYSTKLANADFSSVIIYSLQHEHEQLLRIISSQMSEFMNSYF